MDFFQVYSECDYAEWKNLRNQLQDNERKNRLLSL